jgi:malonyl-CoA decarboxylase
VRLREQLLAHLREHPELRPVDADLHALLTSWFNPGFLSLARMDWNSPASLLEKFLRYERVHKMAHLDDLKRRLAADRRCFAFFHPALPDEPLIFVQVALVEGMADAVRPLIDPDGAVRDPAEAADTAVFYSISNCQEGLRGVSLGSFLIKLVVADLQQQLPDIKTFATLSRSRASPTGSPASGRGTESPALGEAERAASGRSTPPAGTTSRSSPSACASRSPVCAPIISPASGAAAARATRWPASPRQRARLERLNWLADRSEKGCASRSAARELPLRSGPPSSATTRSTPTTARWSARPAVRSLLPSQADRGAVEQDGRQPVRPRTVLDSERLTSPRDGS